MTAVPPTGILRAATEVLGWPDLDRIRATRVGGGCIHPAVHLEHPDPPAGAPGDAFMKWSDEPTGPATPDPPFRVEAEGLRRLRERGGPRIPRVLGHDPGDQDRGGWLLLEYLESVPPRSDDAARLGRDLAHLHRPLPDDWSGSEGLGWIATLPQDNRPRASWAEFWRDARLVPQIERAGSVLGPAVRERLDRVLESVDAALADGIEYPSLLHGDLWSGNVLYTPEGPALVDPAVYRGHREVDLAMMELFGGFGADCFAAYRELAPLRTGYPELRRPLYQLYPLLVHVNLFGSGYVARTDRAARAVLATLR